MKHLLTLVAAVLVALTSAARQPSVYYDQRASLFEVLPVDSTDIVMVGNSLTDGCEWNELFGMPNVKNRGIISDVIEGVADRIDPVLDGHPAKIFLLIGVNDISHKLTADSLATAMSALVDHIIGRSPSTRLYIEACLPVNNDFKRYKNLIGTEQVLLDYNKALRRIADERHLTFIDTFPTFADAAGKLDPEVTNDGLHLTGRGYLRWRELLLPYILE